MSEWEGQTHTISFITRARAPVLVWGSKYRRGARQKGVIVSQFCTSENSVQVRCFYRYIWRENRHPAIIPFDRKTRNITQQQRKWLDSNGKHHLDYNKEMVIIVVVDNHNNNKQLLELGAHRLHWLLLHVKDEDRPQRRPDDAVA